MGEVLTDRLSIARKAVNKADGAGQAVERNMQLSSCGNFFGHRYYRKQDACR
jgi:hypothetical protein